MPSYRGHLSRVISPLAKRLIDVNLRAGGNTLQETGHLKMIRIILPLAIVATLLFAPLYKTSISDQYAGDREISLTASELFIEAPVKCAQNMQFDPRAEGCAPDKGMTGWAFYGAAASSAVAGVLGILGLLPFIGRLTSLVTTAAGGVSTATIGWFLCGPSSEWQYQPVAVGWLACRRAGSSDPDIRPWRHARRRLTTLTPDSKTGL